MYVRNIRIATFDLMSKNVGSGNFNQQNHEKAHFWENAILTY